MLASHRDEDPWGCYRIWGAEPGPGCSYEHSGGAAAFSLDDGRVPCHCPCTVGVVPACRGDDDPMSCKDGVWFLSIRHGPPPGSVHPDTASRDEAHFPSCVSSVPGTCTRATPSGSEATSCHPSPSTSGGHSSAQAVQRRGGRSGRRKW